MEEAVRQISKVVTGGYCSGCGACAYVAGSQMKLNEHGEYVPDITELERKAPKGDVLEKACPFLAPELNENTIGAELYESDCTYSERIGFYRKIYGAYVREGSFRANGTSGGFGTWLGYELMQKGLIDGVIHVKQVENRADNGPFFEYGMSWSVDEIRKGSKTHYHVVEFSKVLEQVRQKEGRYLFIGLPCICKAIRRVQRIEEIIAARIVYVIALICGHLKSIHWTLSLAWGAGIHPRDLKTFQYRTKGPGISARAYVFTAFKKDGSTVQCDSANIIGGKFNAGAMMLGACDYCDDVVGETADVTIGDAWLPRFQHDEQGTNLLIIRNKKLGEMIDAAGSEQRIYLEAISAEEAADTQSGGFRHRRDGLSYRLKKAQTKGLWTPQKRIEPGSIKASKLRAKIYDMRSSFAVTTRSAFKEALEQANYDIYATKVQWQLKTLRNLEVRSVFFRAVKMRIFTAINRVTRSTKPNPK